MLTEEKAVNAFFSNGHEAGRPVTLRTKVRAAMIPPSPMQLTLFGSALYGELYFSLCRALVAPWLEVGWLVYAGRQPCAPSPSPTSPTPPAATVRPDRAEGGSAAARPPEPGGAQVIEVPPGRWQARSASSTADR